MKNLFLPLAAALALGLASQAQAAPTISAAQVTTDTATLAVLPLPDDAINGAIGVVIASQGPNNGFYSGATADLALNMGVYTNGDIATQPADLAGLQHDIAQGGNPTEPVISLFYELATGSTVDIESVRVFSQWQDGRVFYTYDLYTTSDDPPVAGSTWTSVLSGVRPAEYGAGHPAPGSQAVGLTVVADDGSAPLAAGVTGVRFDFYNGGNTLNGFNAPANASQGAWIREIDVVLTSTSVSNWELMH